MKGHLKNSNRVINSPSYNPHTSAFQPVKEDREASTEFLPLLPPLKPLLSVSLLSVLPASLLPNLLADFLAVLPIALSTYL